MRKSVPQNGKNKFIFIPQKIRVVGIKGRCGKGEGQSVPQNGKDKSIFISQKIKVVGSKGRWGKGGGQLVPPNGKNKSLFISQKRRAVIVKIGHSKYQKLFKTLIRNILHDIYCHAHLKTLKPIHHTVPPPPSRPHLIKL